jgi:hypothetical protein
MPTAMEQPRIMTSSARYIAVLTCHPETYSQAVHGIEARICWTEGGGLALTYTLQGDITRVWIPRPRPPLRADYLWQHTCFEAFVSVKDKPEYYEFNFAPSGEWGAYSFRRYRDGAPLLNEQLAPNITVCSAGDSLDLNATIHLHRLPMISQNVCLELGLSAVIEEDHGMLSYWALKHPPGRPDFHHPDGLVLEIEPPDVEVLNDGRMEKR